MGVYDREYYREDEPRGLFVSPSRSVVTNLILINIGIWLVELFTGGGLENALALKPDLFKHPWQAWQLLTYGFVHDSESVWHLFGNMLMLFIVGYELEEIYGKKLFLGIYLSFMVCSGLVWSAVQQATGSNAQVIGASGAIMGLLVVFVMHFPRRTFLVMGIVPMPAWALAAIYLFFDVVGTIQQQGDVAYVAHLAGAAFGFLFYKTGWSLASLIPSGSWWRRVRGPKLRVVHDEESEQTLGQQVDRILEKISREGEASLTKAERKTLEDASRRYQRRKS